MIYLDYAATTPCDEAVVDAMLPFLRGHFGNASSIDHEMGAFANKAVESAREQVADFLGASIRDVIFTGGSTEANNLILRGAGASIVTDALEHPSVLDTITLSLPADAFRIASVSSSGAVDISQLESSLRELGPGSILSIMATNNEIGTRNDMATMSALAHDAGALFHTDATQALTTTAIDMQRDGIDALSLSAHKIYGPKGVGALVCRPPARRNLRALQLGGGHERHLRSGTLNVPGIVGFGEACRLAKSRLKESVRHANQLRMILLEGIRRSFAGAVSVHGGSDASPHILSLRLADVSNRALQGVLRSHLCFALGSACATNKSEPSHVLKAIGLTTREANNTIRLSFGLATRSEDAEAAATLIGEAATSLLSLVA